MGTVTGRIEEIWKYPVKSMVGGTVDEAELSLLGIAGDRHWAVRSLEIGGIRGAKKLGGLMGFAAEFVDGTRVRITLPDGSAVHSDDDDVDSRISAALGHVVTLEKIGRAHV